MLTQLALIAALVIGPERPLGDASLVTAPWTQRLAVAASRGNEALAIWDDTRQQPTSVQRFATRFDSDGNVVDITGIPMPFPFKELQGIAWNGRNYIVAGGFSPIVTCVLATDARIAAPCNTIATDVSLMKLAGNGKEAVAATFGRFSFLDDEGRIARTIELPQFLFPRAIAADGDDWLIFSTRDTCQVSCSATLIQTRVNRAGIISTRDVGFSGAFPLLTVASNGTSHFAAWASAQILNDSLERASWGFSLSDRDGNPIGAPMVVEDALFVLPNGAFVSEFPAAGWDGTQYVMVWLSADATGRGELRMVRVLPDGTMRDRSPITIEATMEATPTVQKHPVFVDAGSKHILLSETPRPVAFGSMYTLVSRGVSSFDALPAAVPRPVTKSRRNQDSAAVAAGDDSTLTVWREDDDPGSIAGELRPLFGAPPQPLRIASPQLRVESPAVSWSAGTYLVVWREEEWTRKDIFILNSGFSIRARRYDRTGRALDAEPFTIAHETRSHRLGTPDSISIASDGAQFLVSWNGGDPRFVHAARVSPGGTVLDATPLSLAPDTPNVFPGLFRGATTLQWTGRDYLAIWWESRIQSEFTDVPSDPVASRGTRIASSGALLDSAFPRFATGDIWRRTYTSAFRSAWNGNEVLLTWSVTDANRLNGVVYTQRFSVSGTALESPHAIATAATSDPHAAWDGASWWIVYSLTNDELRAQRLDSSGNASGVAVSIGTGTPTALVATPGKMLVTYQRFDAASGHVSRVFVRQLTANAKTRAAGR